MSRVRIVPKRRTARLGGKGHLVANSKEQRYKLDMPLEEVLVAEALGEKDLAVIPRVNLFNGEYWSGVRKMDENDLFHFLRNNLIYRERTEELEKDETLKQIIPYFLVKKGNEYLTARRKNTGGDIRLHGGRLIGFGGHLRAGDIKGTMRDWLQREFEEEITTEQVLGISFLGVVNDDGESNNGVGKVHFGLIFAILVKGTTNLREQDKFEDEQFLSISDLAKRKDEMESWSALVTEFLAK